MQHDLDVQALAALPTGRSLPAPSPSDSAENVTQLADVLSIHEYERQRFAQDLHDSAGQLLVALQLSVAQLKRVEGHSGHKDVIDDIQDTVRLIDQEIRSIAFLSYPVELCDRSLPSALESLSRGFGQRTGIRTTCRWVGDRSPIDAAVATAILRVAQEALVNIHRHSKASSATVLVRRQARRLHLAITDNGVGVPLQETGQTRGIGLMGMRHRIEALGGEFRVTNLAPGTEISASVPLLTAG